MLIHAMELLFWFVEEPTTFWLLVSVYVVGRLMQIGYESGTTTFYVNDPGFNQQTYDYSDMSQFVAYGPGLNGKFY